LTFLETQDDIFVMSTTINYFFLPHWRCYVTLNPIYLKTQRVVTLRMSRIDSSNVWCARNK